MNIVTLLLVFAAFSFLYGLLLRYFALPKLSLTRRFKEPTVSCGESSEMIETVSNDRPIWIPWLRVESRISPHLQFGKRENLQVEGDMYHRSIFSLKPYQRIVRRHKVKFLRRGIYNVGSAALSVGDVTGWYQSMREQALEMTVTVLPRLIEEEEMPHPLQQLCNEITRNRQLMTDPFLVRGIRDYQFGDPYRDIHWPASARMQSLQVKIHEYTTDRRLLVLINSQTREDQWDTVMDYEQDAIENLISMAATLCVHTIRSGMEAGFAANMPFIDTDARTSAYYFPDEEKDYEESLLTALARLRILRTLSFPSFLQQIRWDGNMQMIVLSVYTGEELSREIRRMREQGVPIELCCIPQRRTV